jgi:hypothetical protein
MAQQCGLVEFEEISQPSLPGRLPVLGTAITVILIPSTILAIVITAALIGAPHSIVIVVVSRPIVIPAVVPVDVPIAIIVADSACHTVQQRPLAGRVAIPLLLVAFE